jgi:signal transduction histidine kinase/HAMP domain-containing protein
MRRTRGLSLRLIVAIGVLAALHLAVFVTLLVTVGELRDAGRRANAAVHTALAADDARLALARWQAATGTDTRAVRILDTRLHTLVVQSRATRQQQRDRAVARARLAWIAGFTGVCATLLCAVGFLAYVRRAVLAPLRSVSQAARSLAAGDLRARVLDHGGGGEVAELAQTFDEMAASLQDSRAALERQNAELASQSVELVDAVRAAREGASVLRAVLDTTPDAVALLDPAGAVLVDNPPMRALRGFFGTKATAFDATGTLVPLDAGDRDAECRDEIVLMGTRRAFARYAAPVHDERGRQIGRLLALREITGEREAEHAKEDFFALVSHELRTPLTAILGYLELVLTEDRLDPEHAAHLAVVERNARRLLRLVGDLLFGAQVERGSLALEPAPLDVAQLVRDAVALARPRATEAGIELGEQIAPLPQYLGDRDRLAQVLDNLLSNALKFTPPGGRVDVRLGLREDAVELSVADTGVGILPDELPYLFDRFYRATNATAGAVPGLGLGLMIARAIAEGHGGTIAVASDIGNGTTFTVSLPLHRAEAQQTSTADAAPYPAGGRYL